MSEPNLILVASPARDMVHTKFANDLAAAIAYHTMNSPDGVIPYIASGTLIQQQRQDIVDSALRTNATHILWLDTDMRFPRDIIERWLLHDVDFVAANCSKRADPIEPTAIQVDDLTGEWLRVWPNPDKTGLEEVQVIGLAVALMKTGPLNELPRPCFDTPWFEKSQRFVGEDTVFCTRWLKTGARIFIDHDMSWEVQHLGVKPYTMTDCLQESVVHGDYEL